MPLLSIHRRDHARNLGDRLASAVLSVVMGEPRDLEEELARFNTATSLVCGWDPLGVRWEREYRVARDAGVWVADAVAAHLCGEAETLEPALMIYHRDGDGSCRALPMRAWLLSFYCRTTHTTQVWSTHDDEAGARAELDRMARQHPAGFWAVVKAESKDPTKRGFVG